MRGRLARVDWKSGPGNFTFRHFGVPRIVETIGREPVKPALSGTSVNRAATRSAFDIIFTLSDTPIARRDMIVTLQITSHSIADLCGNVLARATESRRRASDGNNNEIGLFPRVVINRAVALLLIRAAPTRDLQTSRFTLVRSAWVTLGRFRKPRKR